MPFLLIAKDPSIALATDGIWVMIVVMYYVYILESEVNPDRYYVGFTEDLKNRLLRHNSGAEQTTTPFKPWKLVWYSAFPSKSKALAFEKYLKSGSGYAFRTRHLL